MKICKCFISILIICMLLMCSCKEQNSGAVSPEPEEDKFEIGLCMDSLVVERWERDRDILMSAAAEHGAIVNVQNANGDSSTQRSQIEYLINKGVDILIIVATDCDNLVDEVEKAHEKGIKVIAYDRMIKNANVDLYISFDNKAVGELMAESLYHRLGDDASIIMINGPTSDNNVSQVENGFKAYAEGKLDIENCIYLNAWKPELAYEYVDNNIEQFEHIDGVMCGNDAIAGQVIRALSTHRLMDNIVVIGQDAELEACQRIVEDIPEMTIYKPINELAEEAAKCAYEMTVGNPIEFAGKINDGKYYIPYIAIKSYAVDRSNIDNYIVDSGFHLRDEVYMYNQ